MSQTVLIVGGGVIGLACAHYLNKAGWSVTVIDKGTIGGGASWGNCGFVCPSHVLPLTEPGMVAQGLAALFRRNGALAIRPRFNPSLWSWLIRFARRCNRRDMLESARGIQPLLDVSRALYDQLMIQEKLDCEWEARGLLFPYKSPKRFEAFATTNQLLTEMFQRPAERIEGDALLKVEPALKPGLAGGWFYSGDAHLRPDCLMRSWRRTLENSGVIFREHCAFESFERLDGRASAALTEAGRIAADAFVIAAGAWTPKLNAQLGCKAPIQPGKGYSITMPRPEICPSIPLIFPETHVAVTPFRSGYRLGSTMEFAGYDETIKPRRLKILRDGAAPYLREPETEPVEQTWFGWRPMTWDGLPIIDHAPALRNVLIAAGHNMLGLSMAPATGKLASQLLGGEKPFIDPKPYRAGRF